MHWKIGRMGFSFFVFTTATLIFICGGIWFIVGAGSSGRSQWPCCFFLKMSYPYKVQVIHPAWTTALLDDSVWIGCKFTSFYLQESGGGGQLRQVGPPFLEKYGNFHILTHTKTYSVDFFLEDPWHHHSAIFSIRTTYLDITTHSLKNIDIISLPW